MQMANRPKGPQMESGYKLAQIGSRSVQGGLSRGLAGIGITYWMLVAYLFFDYVRPHYYLNFLQPFKIPTLLAVILLLLWLWHGDKKVLKDPLIILYIGFTVLAGSTVVFAFNSFWVYHHTRNLTVYLISVVLPFIMLSGSPATIGTFFRLWVGIQVLLALEGIAAGGTGPGSILLDENDLALALNMAIPYAFFLSESPRSKGVMRILLLIATGILSVGVIVTNSRGGFLGLAVVAGGIAFYSKNRVRNFLLLALFAGIVVAQDPSYIMEIKTITDKTNNTRVDREYSWRRGLEMFYDNPILGVGAGNYPWRVLEYERRSREYDSATMRSHGGRTAHSLYFTLIPELGLAGVAVFGSMLIVMLRRLRKMVRNMRSHKIADPVVVDLEFILRAVTVSLLSYLVCGAFLSVLYYPHFWYLVGFVSGLSYAVNSCIAKLDADGVAHD
jgi:O-antigen ligase